MKCKETVEPLVGPRLSLSGFPLTQPTVAQRSALPSPRAPPDSGMPRGCRVTGHGDRSSPCSPHTAVLPGSPNSGDGRGTNFYLFKRTNQFMDNLLKVCFEPGQFSTTAASEPVTYFSRGPSLPPTSYASVLPRDLVQNTILFCFTLAFKTVHA